jgi:hypothetical protein
MAIAATLAFHLPNVCFVAFRALYAKWPTNSRYELAGYFLSPKLKYHRMKRGMFAFVRRSAVHIAEDRGRNLKASLDELRILFGRLSYPSGHVHRSFMVYADELF